MTWHRSVTTTVSPMADLAVSQSVSPGSVFVSNNVTFTIVVANKGPDTGNNVVLTDSLPLLFLSVKHNGAGRGPRRTEMLTFNTASLASGASPAATVVVDSHVRRKCSKAPPE